MAIHHPERLHSLVAFGAGWDMTRSAPWYPDWITNATIDDLKDWANAYRAVSPHPERAELVLEKVRAMQLAPKKITTDLLKTIPVPVLVMDGENEEFFSLDLPKELAAAVPNAELSLMKGTGHFAMWEKPEEFNAILMEYLRRH